MHLTTNEMARTALRAGARRELQNTLETLQNRLRLYITSELRNFRTLDLSKNKMQARNKLFTLTTFLTNFPTITYDLA
jgi:hypothetical protein